MTSHALSKVEDSAASIAIDPDEWMVRSAQAGDRGAFESLYRRHVKRLYGVVWRLCAGEQTQADDVVQESFIRAWQGLPKFRFECQFSTWLHRLGVNTALGRLRSQREEVEWSEHDWQNATSESMTVRICSQMDLESAIARLPMRARMVVVLHDCEGWKHEEIAAELSIAVGTSKATLHRARQLLIKHLGGSDGNN